MVVHAQSMSSPGSFSDLGLFIPMRFQDELKSLVSFDPGFVARHSQIAADMLHPRASPGSKHPSRLQLILKAIGICHFASE